MPDPGDHDLTPTGVHDVALSVRQHEVLTLMDQGLSARAVAARLGITETTARNHIHALLKRLGCHSQLQAVAHARSHGLLP